MAITINKQGKFDSLVALDPLLLLLIDSSGMTGPMIFDMGALRSAVLALKNSAEYPQARKAIEKLARRRGLDPNFLTDMCLGKMHDAEDWPASERYVDQWRRDADKYYY